MSSINPFAGYVAQGSQVERAQVSEKTRQVRREQALSKNVAIRDDEMEHQVESTDAIPPIHDEQSSPQQQDPKRGKRRPNEGDEPPHLDVKA